MIEEEYWPRFASLLNSQSYIVRCPEIRFEKKDILEIDLLGVRFSNIDLKPFWIIGEISSSENKSICREIFFLESAAKYFHAESSFLIIRKEEGLKQTHYDFAKKRNVHLIPFDFINTLQMNELAKKTYEYTAVQSKSSYLKLFKQSPTVDPDPLRELAHGYCGIWAINNPYDRIVATDSLLSTTIKIHERYVTPQYRLGLSWLIRELSIIRFISLIECTHDCIQKFGSIDLSSYLTSNFEGATEADRISNKTIDGGDYGKKLTNKYLPIIDANHRYPENTIRLLQMLNDNTYLNKRSSFEGIFNTEFYQKITPIIVDFEKSYRTLS